MGVSMKSKSFFSVAFVLGLGLNTVSFAQEPTKEKTEEKFHCEKTEKGKTSEIEAKDKAECKKLGGKWSKPSKDHKHN